MQATYHYRRLLLERRYIQYVTAVDVVLTGCLRPYRLTPCTTAVQRFHPLCMHFETVTTVQVCTCGIPLRVWAAKDQWYTYT